MDDEGQRLAGLSDAEWAKRVKKIEREVERERRGSSPSRRYWSLAAGLVVVVVVAAVLVTRSSHNSPSPGSSPSTTPVAAGPFGASPAANWQPAAAALIMPPATQVGPYPASVVSGALARARAYLLAGRSSVPVLVKHETAALQAAVDPATLSSTRKEPIQQQLVATFLAPGNHLAAPVRLKGSVTDSYVPPTGRIAGHLLVSGNVVWAYALKADYPVAPIPSHVLAIHEHVDLAFYLSADMSGPHAKPSPIKDDALWFDTDCGYFHQQLLGLPRINDPDAAPVREGDTNQKAGFDPNSDVDVSTHACRQN